MDGLGMLPFFPYPWLPFFYQAGALGELLMVYCTFGGDLVVQPVAPAGSWNFIPMDLPAIALYPAVLSGRVPLPWWMGGTDVFFPLPMPPYMPSEAYRTPNSTPNKVAVRPQCGRKLELRAPAAKEAVNLDTEAGPSNVKSTSVNEKQSKPQRKPKAVWRKSSRVAQPEPQEKGKNKEVLQEEQEEATAPTVEEFPVLRLLPEEWTY